MKTLLNTICAVLVGGVFIAGLSYIAILFPFESAGLLIVAYIGRLAYDIGQELIAEFQRKD